MDAEDLLNGLESIRGAIPGFLQGAYDNLVKAVRQIYEGVTRFMISEPIASVDE